jgi:uncharacterized protein YeaO (DUF488 family)
MLRTKRVYDRPARGDGYRVLVDRLWPRGLSKEEARVDIWLKDIAPSGELRKWFGHDPQRWPEFKRRYFRELDRKAELAERIPRRGKTVTLLFGAKDEEHNNAVALREYLEKRAG